MNTEKKQKRTYTEEFKRDALSLVTEQGYTAAEAARSLGINRRGEAHASPLRSA